MPFARTQRRLVAWNLLVFALVLAALIGTAIAGEVRAHHAAVDRDLRAAAARASARLEHDEDEAREHGRRRKHDEHEQHEQREPRGRRERREAVSSAPDPLVYSRLAGEAAPAGGEAGGLPDEAALARALSGVESFSEQTVGGEPVRLLSRPVRHEGRVIGAVQVGLAVAADRQVLSRSIFILLVTGAAGLVASLLGSAFLAGRAMKPIAEVFERQRKFLADASHELRTPVAVVRARAELLARESGEAPAAVRDELRRLERDAAELSGLLDDLLDLSRLDAGAARLSAEPLPLADVADEIVEQLGPLAAERGVSLTAAAAPVWARGDLTRVRQVLRALVDNAVKHTPQGGSVRLKVAREGDWARVEVADTGEGIAPEHLPRVLDRFYRADSSRTRERGTKGGAGLGLAIAAELTRWMKGTMSLESTPGRGTTAVVRLPMAEG